MISQTLKTLESPFTAWRTLERVQALRSRESFGRLDHYRDLLDGVKSLTDFVLDVSRELVYADKIAVALSRGPGHEGSMEVDISDAEESRLRALAERRRGKQVKCFNSADGINLRLGVRSYHQR